MAEQYTLLELRDLARGKIKGFTKMKKADLYNELVTRNILKEEKKEETTIPLSSPLSSPLIGISPPEWDFDHLNPIPDFLLPYYYLYSAGSSEKEIRRYFLVPDNFVLKAISLPRKGRNNGGEYRITVGDWRNLLGDNIDETFHAVIDDQEVVVPIHLVYFEDLKRNSNNRPAPQIGSSAWFSILASHQVVNMHVLRTCMSQDAKHLVNMRGDKKRTSPQLRYQYQIITYPQVEPPCEETD